MCGVTVKCHKTLVSVCLIYTDGLVQDVVTPLLRHWSYHSLIKTTISTNMRLLFIYTMWADFGVNPHCVCRCPNNASVTSHSRAPYGLFPGCFEQKSYVHTGLAQAPCGAVQILPPRTGESFNACIISLRALYTFRDCKQAVNSPCGDRKGPYGPRTAKKDACVGFLPIMVGSIPLHVHKGNVQHHCGSRRAPYGSCRIWKTLKIPVLGQYDTRTGIARGTHGVLRIIQPNHKYADVSSHTGPVA